MEGLQVIDVDSAGGVTAWLSALPVRDLGQGRDEFGASSICNSPKICGIENPKKSPRKSWNRNLLLDR